MILAAGLTPAWQQIVVLDQFDVGRVNRAREVHWTASGKVLNVGFALHHLGGPNQTLALVGGASGRSIDETCSSGGLRCRWIWAQNPARVCTTILDRSAGTATELVENAGAVGPEELQSFLGAYEECAAEADIAVLSGSLPPGTPASFYRQLIERTRGRVILDASGPELLQALPARPTCVKPNRDELARTLGRRFHRDEDLKDAMLEVHRRGAGCVLVSHGGDSLWVCAGGRFHAFRPPRVEVVNPIGSGDCLAAGVAWSLRAGSEMLEAIRFGMAAAAENATVLLPARLDLDRVRAWLPRIG